MRFIKRFNEISINDIALVGGKNASLGSMIQQLIPQGVRIPDGFAITADAYWHVVQQNNLKEPMQHALNQLKDINDINQLRQTGLKIRLLFEHAKLPQDLIDEITQAYQDLSKEYKRKNIAVAVRSSATAEDLPTASFAGQQDSFLNVKGIDELLLYYKKCLASLFNDRAIAYRIEKGFDHFKVALSVGVQKIVRSDKASSGVMFTLDTETGFPDVIIINASWGLGETIVQGIVNPDEFWVHKPTLQKDFKPIIKKQIGQKTKKIVFNSSKQSLTKQMRVSKKDQSIFSLADEEILELARYGLLIEQYYSDVHKQWTPMDIEWAKDGNDGQLYIVQARPETIHGNKKNQLFEQVTITGLSEEQLKKITIISGQSIGQGVASGIARVISSIDALDTFNDGDILVTTMTDPDWTPIMKRAAAIVTDRGGRTSHAAIVSRELGIPAIVGTGKATNIITQNQEITIDCSRGQRGYVYDGKLSFAKESIDTERLKKPEKAHILVNCAEPERAFLYSYLPVDGVGLARIEFIISNYIKIHPMAAIEPEKIDNKKIIKQISALTAAYHDAQDFFVSVLAQGIGMIAAAFYPKAVIVRTSDFKSNEYRNLLGGSYYETVEENPMLGLRGASRYYHESYAPAFALECAALKMTREIMGFENIKIMIPFVRTLQEAEKVSKILEQHGLIRGNHGLELYMMAEIPSNALLIDEFAHFYDGFSIGSNDLTQTTLAVDRDSAVLASLFKEDDPALKKMYKLIIDGSLQAKKQIGICGQGPSDNPQLAYFLIDAGINSLSLNPDAVIPFLKKYTDDYGH